MKRLSVITVNYNDKVGLLKTIQSVICQTDRDNIEFIVIDGGSTDGSYDVIRQYENHIDYWVSEADKGIYNAMNKGISIAKGDYCNFMNSGDTFHSPDVVSDVFNQCRDKDIICGNALTVEETPWHMIPDEIITMESLYKKSINHQSAFIRTNLLKKYGYDEKYRIVADRKFFVQALILDNCSYGKVDVDVVDYDVTGFSSKNRYASKVEYESVLHELFPSRILADYGKEKNGALYGDSDYEKLFLELKGRNYRYVVYTFAVIYVRLVSLFKKSASFIKDFPYLLKN